VCLLLLALLAAMPGCSRLRHLHDQQHEMVYVWTRQMFLRDRVAAVSNHVAEVTNGQPLEVLEHGRRFLRVKTAKGEIGWIPDRAVIDAKTYSAFAELAARHKDDPVVADGTVRDDIYLHARPGRETDRFYLLAGDTRVKMLVRASVPREAGKVPDHVHAAAKPGTRAAAEPAPEHAPEPVAMEDWWLVRDAQNRVGWALGSRVDVNVPDDVAQYAEGQRMVGAYVIARVHDDEATAADHEVPEYVTALGPPKSGLPFDFDEIRVFTWSLKKHRYETAFRIHPIQGFLPVLITSEPALKGTEPVFSFRISSSPDVAINPDTGITSPVQPRTITYALRDTAVRRVGPDMAPIPIVRDKDEKAKTPPKKHR
jgi:SH3-like domain-containing protein